MTQTKNSYIETLNFFDLIEDKKINFYYFINEGIEKILSKLNSNSTNNNDVLSIFTNEYFFKFSNSKSKKTFKDETVNFSLYIPAEITNKKTNTIKKFNLFICNLPLPLENNTFWINGTPKTIHQQLAFDPVLLMESKKHGTQVTIYDEKQESTLQILLNNDGEIKINKFAQYLANIFLEIFFYNKKINDNALNNLYTALAEEQINLEEIKKRKLKNLKSINKDLTSFDLINQLKITEKIRYRLNNKLNIVLADNVLYLTKIDIDKVKELLSKSKNYEIIIPELDDLENKSIKYVNEYLMNIIHYNIDNITNLIKISDDLQNNIIDLVNKIKQNNISYEIDELFSNSDISLPIEQTNPLTEVAQQRKLLNLKKQEGNKNISMDIRNIHPSIFGRLCPIDTPEGDSAGLITSLTTLSLSNRFGLIKTPLLFIKNHREILENRINFYTTNKEDLKIIKFSSEQINYFSIILKKNVKINKEFTESNAKDICFSFISYLQVFSLACSNIPFLEHNDGNRILMGANMQKQAVPLLFPENTIVGSGIEETIAMSSNTIKSLSNGTIIYCDSTKIIIKTSKNKRLVYFLDKVKPTFNDTVINNTNAYWIGEKVELGQILTNGFSIKNSELALGTNLTVAYMNWDGFNFEDAIVISDRLLKNDKLTSLQVKTILIEINEGEEFHYLHANLDLGLKGSKLKNFGIITKNKSVNVGDILLIKEKKTNEAGVPLSNKKLLFVESDFTGFISNIEIKDPEIDVTNNTIVECHNKILKIDILQIRKIYIGDKLSGRYGNKGVVSKILPEIDMPFLLDGTVVDILLNPLGIPSRMNVGQIFETLLGFIGTNLHNRYKLLSFDECFGKHASKILINQKLKENKLKLKKSYCFLNDNSDKNYVVDGRTGEIMDNPVLVGRTYILKLFHLAQDKVTSRTLGPNSLITSQPLKGKKLNGGQRFGEMEVWALEAYGAAYTLYEMLTLKSDDIFMNNKLLKILEEDSLLDQINYSKSLFIFDLDLKSLGFDLSLTVENFVENKFYSNDILNLLKKQDLFISANKIFNDIYFNYGK